MNKDLISYSVTIDNRQKHLIILTQLKNSPVSQQLELQEQDIQYNERKIEINQDNYQENLLYINPVNKDVRKQTINYIANKQKSNEDINTLTNQESEQITNSFISFITSQREVLPIVQEDVSQTKRKKGKNRRV